MTEVPTDEEAGRQILSVFLRYKIRPGGTLRRNHFAEVREADFQRGINKAVENDWIRIKPRDRSATHTNSQTRVLQQFKFWFSAETRSHFDRSSTVQKIKIFEASIAA